MCSAWMTHAQRHASFTNWRRTKWRKTGRALLLFVLSTKTTTERFLLKMCQWNGNSLRIIYNLQFERAIPGLIFSLLLFNKNNTWRPTCFIVQTTGFNRPAKFLILLKHWGYIVEAPGYSRHPTSILAMQLLNAFKCNLTELTTKSAFSAWGQRPLACTCPVAGHIDHVIH